MIGARRYFEQFFPGHMPQEITKEAAEARAYYIVECQAPRRYERFHDGELEGVIYPDCGDPDPALADFRARYPASMWARVYSPYVRDEETSSFRVWHAPNGHVERQLRYVYQNDSPDYRTELYDPDGALRKYEDYIHADWGLAEIKRYDGEGNLVGHEDVDP